MEKRIRVRIGTVLNDNGVDILSEDGGSLLHSLYKVIEQELDRAREEGYADGVEHRKRRAMKYFMDGKVGDDLDLLDHADSTYKLTTK